MGVDVGEAGAALAAIEVVSEGSVWVQLEGSFRVIEVEGQLPCN